MSRFWSAGLRRAGYSYRQSEGCTRMVPAKFGRERLRLLQGLDKLNEWRASKRFRFRLRLSCDALAGIENDRMRFWSDRIISCQAAPSEKPQSEFSKSPPRPTSPRLDSRSRSASIASITSGAAGDSDPSTTPSNSASSVILFLAFLFLASRASDALDKVRPSNVSSIARRQRA